MITKNNILALWTWVILFSISCQEEHAILFFSDPEDTPKDLSKALQAYCDGQSYHLIRSNAVTTLTDDTLAYYSAVLLDQMALNELNHFQLDALERFINAGGTLLGTNLTAAEQDIFRSPDLSAAIQSGLFTPKILQTQLGKGTLYLHDNNDAHNDWQEIYSQAFDDMEFPRYENLEAEKLPPDHWFEIDTLTMSLDEPMELEVLANGDVIFIERPGDVKLCKAEDRSIKTIANIDVIHTESNGLNGLALDPNFAKNQRIYLSYLSATDTIHQRISRFVLRHDKLDLKSEEIIMNIPIDKANGWHGTNSIEFDRAGNLYIGMGDFTLQSKDIGGYAQIDERPGNKNIDAQRTSASSNSYKGKILRIHPEEDGSYSIPVDNLFSHKTDSTLPEIYVMGCRNPYRFTADPHSDRLFFGDVGPDAWEDGDKGPGGYDELNIAGSGGGFYGWPYFVANNQPYRDFNYSTKDIGPFFDPSSPSNDSPNSTGIKKLPIAKTPALYYPKAESAKFPYVGSGGENIMVGPKYYFDDFPESTRFPRFFDKKLFLYDWVRNWILILSFDGKNQIDRIYPFLSTHRFTKMIDMAFGPNGALYILEYGNRGFQSNADASIKRIRYTPNKLAPLSGPKSNDPADLFASLLPQKLGYENGRQLILANPCMSCHHPQDKLIGPSFEQIAERYSTSKKVVDLLSLSIIEGSTGNWPGNIIMPAHASLTPGDADYIVRYILTF